MPPRELAPRAFPVAVACAAAALVSLAAWQRARDLGPQPPPAAQAPPALPPGGLDHRSLPAAPAPP